MYSIALQKLESTSRAYKLLPPIPRSPDPLVTSTKMIRDSNPDFRIDPDPDVHRIAAKMWWIQSVVGISHFGDCIRNAGKSAKTFYSAVLREEAQLSAPRSVSLKIVLGK